MSQSKSTPKTVSILKLVTTADASGAVGLNLLAQSQPTDSTALEMHGFTLNQSIRIAKPATLIQYAAHFNSVTVVAGNPGIIDLVNQEFISDALHENHSHINHKWYKNRNVSLDSEKNAAVLHDVKPAVQVDCAISLFSWDNSNQAHWLAEQLPRFFWISQATLPPNTVVLVEEGISPSLIEALELFWDPSRITYIAPGQSVEVAALFHFSHTAEIYEPRLNYEFSGNENHIYPAAITWMAENIQNSLSTLDASSYSAKTELFLVPSASHHNYVIENQAEVVSTLRELDFDAVDLNLKPLSEQVATLAQARLIIAPFGSIVAQLLWMPAGSCMAVLVQDNACVRYWLFHAMAEACGVHLIYLPALPAQAEKNKNYSKEYICIQIVSDYLAPWIKNLRLLHLNSSSKLKRLTGTPLVSICITAYQHEKYISECLDSVLAQTYDNTEIIVIDDGSKDNTGKIILDYAQRHPEKIRAIVFPFNTGVSTAANNATSLARGEFIAFLASDDRMHPDRIKEQVAYLLKNKPCSAVFSHIRVIDDQGSLIPKSGISNLFNTPTPYLKNRLLASNFLNAPSCTVRTSSLFKAGEFSPLLRYVQDYDLWIRILAKGDIAVLPLQLTDYRVHGKNLSFLSEGESVNYQMQIEMISVIVRAAQIWPWQSLVPAGQDMPQESSVLLALSLHLAIVDFHYLGRPALGTAFAYELILRSAHSDPQKAAYGKKELETWLQGGDVPVAVQSQPLGIFSIEKNWTSTNSNPYEDWLQHTRTNPIIKYPLSDTCWLIAIGLTHQKTESILNYKNKTEKSLLAQTHSAENVIWLNGNKIELSNALHNSWTLLLCEGDTLEPDALQLISYSLAQADNENTLIAYFDHDEIDAEGKLHSPHFKPDFNHDLLLSSAYMGRALAVRTDWAQPLLEQAGSVFDVAFAYRLMLQALRDAGPTAFVHVPAVLAHLMPEEPAVFVQTSEAWQALANSLQTHLELTAPDAQLLEGPAPGTFHVVHPLPRTPLVSIVIPTRDQLPLLSRCVESLLSNTDYPAFELLIVDNGSQTAEALEFLAGLEALGTEQIRVLRAQGERNFSRMHNLAVAQARGEFVVLLDNDVAALQPDWLGHLVRHALRDGVGVVGARLVNVEGKLQHAGIVMGLRGPAEHPCVGLDSTEPGYLFRAQLTQNFSAVSEACLLVSKALYEEVGGLDEGTFGVSYNGIDFCLRVSQTGRRIVWTPLATLLRDDSASPTADIDNKSANQKKQRFAKEQEAMYQRWPTVIANDPAYNPNLSLTEQGYEVETNPLLCFNKLQGLVEHRIAAFAADDQGCGNYRVLQPLQAMLKAGLCTGGASPEIFSPNLALRSGADTLIFQRPNSEGMQAHLKSLLQLKGIKKIYEIDDHLARLPIKSAHYEHMPKDTRGKMIKSIGLCDRLVVSTEPLARELGAYNSDVRVVPNCLPEAMWGTTPPARGEYAARPAGRKPKVGWAGGVSHQGDLEMIAGVMKDLANTVDFVFFGMCPEALLPYVKEFHLGIPTLEYPDRLMEIAQDWDLAIAPLENNAFNDYKSNLKLLEYGWCGVPVVCSDVLPYQGDLPATRVKNRYKNWREAILEHVNNPEASRQQGLDLQARISSDWRLTGDNLQRWYQAWTD